MGTITRTKLVSIGALVAGICAAGPAAAQSPPPADATATGVAPQPAASASAEPSAPAGNDQLTSKADNLDDIVVTARRRQESLQTVPTSITALSSEALGQKQVRNISDLTVTVPGINFTGFSTPYNTSVTIRGLSRAATATATPAVVTYVNDVPLQNFGSALPTYDLASIQVLKGPQGTYFGRNTTGGAILVTTQQPTYDLGGYASILGGSYNWLEGEGAINLPIVDQKVALRAAFKISDRDGYTKNLSNNGDDFDNLHDRAYRVSLLIEPVEGLRSTTIYDYSKGEDVTASILNNALPVGVARNPALAPLFDCGTSPSCDVDLALARQKQIGVRATYTSVVPQTQIVVKGINNTTTADLGFVTIKNIFGYRKVIFSGGFNADGTEMKIIDSYQISSDRQLTDEAQLSGTLFGDRLSWLVGGFYLKTKPTGIDVSFRQVATAATTPLAGTPYVYQYFSDSSKAVYGQLIYDLSDLIHGLKLNAGYRETKDGQSGCTPVPTTVFGRPAVSYGQCRSSATSVQPSVSKRAPSYTFGADFQASRDAFFYVTTRRGNRGPGFNSTVLRGALAAYQGYAPEKVQDVEIGTKLNFRFGGMTGRLDLAAYRSTQSNIQSTIQGLPANFLASGNPAGLSIIANFGKVRVKGIDFDALLRPVERLSLQVNGSYTDAKYIDYALPSAFSTIVSPTPAVLYQPKFSGTASADYDMPLAGTAGRVTFDVTAYHSSRINYGAYFAPSYETVSARIDWREALGYPVDIGVFVRNLTDKKYISGPSLPVTSLTVTSAVYGAPRMAGVQATYHFGTR